MVNTTDLNRGQAIPQSVTVRDNYIDAMADWTNITGVSGDTKPIYIKQTEIIR